MLISFQKKSKKYIHAHFPDEAITLLHIHFSPTFLRETVELEGEGRGWSSETDGLRSKPPPLPKNRVSIHRVLPQYTRLMREQKRSVHMQGEKNLIFPAIF